jgi:hypothetical protein
MSATEICEPRFDDGVEYICYHAVAQLEMNRAEEDPLRWRSPEGTTKFLCKDCLMDMLNARARRRNGKVNQ